MTRIKIDPITRIEGHLSIEVEVENGVVTDAWSAGNMVLGFEIILQDKDPRDAPYITSRICGVCQGVHSIASSHAWMMPSALMYPRQADYYAASYAPASI